MVALARSSAQASAPGGRVPSLAPGLRVRGFGVVEITRDRVAVDAGRGRELLLYLLCNPRGATKEQIGAALWPEAEPAKTLDGSTSPSNHSAVTAVPAKGRLPSGEVSRSSPE